MIRKLLLASSAFALVVACSPADVSEEDAANGVENTEEMASAAAVLGDWGVESQHISESVDPGDDFFRYVNEGWLESAELPQGFSSLGAFT